VSAERLSATSWTPEYERGGPAPIAHLGVGAFARAHLGVYADDLLRSGWPARIRGVSLRSPRAAKQLGPQDGLYTLVEREPGEDCPPRVLGAIGSVATGRAAAVEAIAAPETTLVTLTVTEKAYEPDQAPAVVAEGLARRDRTLPAPVVASLDNVLDNGALLRHRVLEAADADLARWIAEEVRFPSSVVDRMVPATTPADLDEVERRLGLRDEAAVVAEHHCSWVLEEVDGLPPLGDVGVEVVSDVGPYQRRKLWLLNAPHSALAYGGLLAGCETIAEAAAHPVVAPFVRRLVDDVLEVAEVPDPRPFAADALRRFRNPALGHTCRQVGTDGSQKLPQRILPVVAARRERRLPTARLAIVVAAFELAALDDPVAIADPAFLAEVAGKLEDLRQRGVDVLREAA
jgi:fructuronate reductase